MFADRDRRPVPQHCKNGAVVAHRDHDVRIVDQGDQFIRPVDWPGKGKFGQQRKIERGLKEADLVILRVDQAAALRDLVPGSKFQDPQLAMAVRAGCGSVAARMS